MLSFFGRTKCWAPLPPPHFLSTHPPLMCPEGYPPPSGCTFRSRGSCGIHDGEAGSGRLQARGGGYLSLSMRHPLLPPLQKMGDHPPPPAFPEDRLPPPLGRSRSGCASRGVTVGTGICRPSWKDEGCPPIMWPEGYPPPHSSGRGGDPLPPTFWK